MDGLFCRGTPLAVRIGLAFNLRILVILDTLHDPIAGFIVADSTFMFAFCTFISARDFGQRQIVMDCSPLENQKFRDRVPSRPSPITRIEMSAALFLYRRWTIDVVSTGFRYARLAGQNVR